MRTNLRVLSLIITATVSAACAAGLADPTVDVHSQKAPDMVGLAEAMRAIARGEADVSAALAPFAILPAPAKVPESGDLRFPGFRDAAGYVLRELEVRVRKQGIDGAPLVVAYLAPEPCIELEPLAARLEATEPFGIPPSPHAPAGTPGVRGYTVQYPDGGSLSISARTDAPNCTIGISTRRPNS